MTSTEPVSLPLYPDHSYYRIRNDDDGEYVPLADVNDILHVELSRGNRIHAKDDTDYDFLWNFLVDYKKGPTSRETKVTQQVCFINIIFNH